LADFVKGAGGDQDFPGHGGEPSGRPLGAK
jgi:hypothetical protein